MNIYNSLLIEAGHIAQNIAITATKLGLSCVFTNAIDITNLNTLLNLPFPDVIPIYLIGLGYHDENSIDDYSEDLLKEFADILHG